MFYEINVSHNGKHLFATAERSLTTRADMEKLYGIFKEKFPETDGYKVSVTYWEKIGQPVKLQQTKGEIL